MDAVAVAAAAAAVDDHQQLRVVGTAMDAAAAAVGVAFGAAADHRVVGVAFGAAAAADAPRLLHELAPMRNPSKLRMPWDGHETEMRD